jgi:hypothetical protein
MGQFEHEPTERSVLTAQMPRFSAPAKIDRRNKTAIFF